MLENLSKKLCVNLAQKRLQVCCSEQNNLIVQNAVWVSHSTFKFFAEKDEKVPHYIQIANRVFCVKSAEIPESTIVLNKFQYIALKRSESILVSRFDPKSDTVLLVGSVSLYVKTVYNKEEKLRVEQNVLNKKIVSAIKKIFFRKNDVFWFEYRGRVLECSIREIEISNETGLGDLFFGKFNKETVIKTILCAENIIFNGCEEVVEKVAENETPVSWLFKEKLLQELKTSGVFGVDKYIDVIQEILLCHTSSYLNMLKKFDLKKTVKWVCLCGKQGTGKTYLEMKFLNLLKIDEKKNVLYIEFRDILEYPNYLSFANDVEEKMKEIFLWLEAISPNTLCALVLDHPNETVFCGSGYSKVRNKLDELNHVFVLVLSRERIGDDILCDKIYRKDIQLKGLSEPACSEMLQFLLVKKKGISGEIDCVGLANKIKNFTTKEVVDVVLFAKQFAAHRLLKSYCKQGDSSEPLKLTMDDFELAINSLKQQRKDTPISLMYI